MLGRTMGRKIPGLVAALLMSQWEFPLPNTHILYMGTHTHTQISLQASAACFE